MVKNYYSIAILILILDQVTKGLARSITEPITLIPNFFNLTYITNTGASFGILKGFNLVLIFLSVAVLVFLYHHRFSVKNNLERIWIWVIVSGIIGNLIDRVFFEAVTDFINFNFWPAFNVADSAITIGVIALLIIWRKQK